MSKRVLVITSKDDVTVDFVITQLQEHKKRYYRFNTEDIGSSIKIYFDGDYWITDKNKNRNINFNEFDSVYFRRPKLPMPMQNLTDGEKQFYLMEIETYLEGLYRSLSDKYWLNHIFDIRLLENKPYQLCLAKDIGFSVPEFCISNNEETSLKFIEKYELCVFKPLKIGLIQEPQGTGKILYTTEVDATLTENISTLGAMPLYLQRKIEKECDVRVTVVGEHIFAAKILSQEVDVSRVDWRKSETMLQHERVNIPNEIKVKCLTLCSKFNLGFAAIDFVIDLKGNYWFLEINPNGQWAWIENILEYPISHEIVNLLVAGDDKCLKE